LALEYQALISSFLFLLIWFNFSKQVTTESWEVLVRRRNLNY